MRVWRMSVWPLSVAYIGLKSRTERPRKTKIGTEVAHIIRDSDTTFKVKRSTCRVRGIFWRLSAQLVRDTVYVVVFYYMFMCVSCFGLVVSTCQVIGWKDSSGDTFVWCGDYLHKAQVEEIVYVFFSSVWFVYVAVCSPSPTGDIFHTL